MEPVQSLISISHSSITCAYSQVSIRLAAKSPFPVYWGNTVSSTWPEEVFAANDILKLTPSEPDFLLFSRTCIMVLKLYPKNIPSCAFIYHIPPVFSVAHSAHPASCYEEAWNLNVSSKARYITPSSHGFLSMWSCPVLNNLLVSTASCREREG